MKKLLLLATLALGITTASAGTFLESYVVTCEGKPVTQGMTIYSSYLNEASKQFEAPDVRVTLTEAAFIAELNIVSEFTGVPTYEEYKADKMAWGQPAVCYAIENGDARCEGMVGELISDINLRTTSPVDVQFHLQSGGFPPAAPTKTGTYKVTLSATVSGDDLTEPLVYYVVIGPDAAGVDGVIDDANVPAEYFDMTGRRVLNPEKGQLVIERKGNKTSKLIF